MQALLMSDLNLSVVEFGLLATYFYIPYSLMQIPVGIIVDKYGPYLLLVFAAFSIGVACLLFSFVQGISLAIISRVIIGIAASFAFVGAIRLAATWHSKEKMGIIVGMTQSVGMVGAIFTTPLAYALQTVSWRSAFIFFAFLMIVLSILLYFFAYPKPGVKVQEKEPTPIMESLKIVLSHPMTWVNAVFVGIFFNFSTAFGENWGVSFLNQAYGMPNHIAAFYKNLVFFGWIVGGPFLGWLSDKIKKRKAVMIPAYILMSVCYFVLMYVPNLSNLSLGVLIFLTGIGSSGAAICYTYSTEILPEKVAGTALSISNMASILVGTVFVPIIGNILVTKVPSKVLNGIPYYDLPAFQAAFMPITVSIVLGIFFGLVLKEKTAK
jgi:MFS family permease